jgi:hypothetical protein
MIREKSKKPQKVFLIYTGRNGRFSGLDTVRDRPSRTLAILHPTTD